MPSHPRESKIESRLNELFGHETSLKDLKISKKFVELFGDAPNPNKNLIRDIKKRRNSSYCLEKYPSLSRKLKKGRIQKNSKLKLKRG